MKFKPRKSRRLVLRKGHISKRFRIIFQGEVLPALIENIPATNAQAEKGLEWHIFTSGQRLTRRKEGAWRKER